MAELPVYQRRSSLVSRIPEIDFTRAAQAQAVGFQSMSDALDRLSSFAFQRAEAKAQQAGIEYRYEHPVTADQIKDALASGRDVSEIVGDDWTVFGRASRATAVAQLKTDLEIKTQQELVNLDAMVDAGVLVDPGEFNTRVEGMIDGYADVLASLDPEKAIQYRAAAASSANSVYKGLLERRYKMANSGNVARFNSFIEDAPRLFESTVKNSAGGVTPDGTPEMDVQIAMIARQINDAAVATGDPSIVGRTPALIQKMVYEARVSVLVANGIEGGKVPSRNANWGRYQSIWDGLTERERADVMQRWRAEDSAQHQASERARIQQDRSISQAVDAAIYQARYGTPEEQAAARAQLNRLGELGHVSSEQIRNINEPTERVTVGDYKNIDEIRADIRNGGILTQGDLTERMDLFGIPASRRDALRQMLEDEKKEDKKALTQVAENMQTKPNKAETARIVDAVTRIVDKHNEENPEQPWAYNDQRAIDLFKKGRDERERQQDLSNAIRNARGNERASRYLEKIDLENITAVKDALDNLNKTVPGSFWNGRDAERNSVEQQLNAILSILER